MSRLTFYVLLLLAFVSLFFTVAGSHGLLHLAQINHEYDILAEKNRSIESEIVSLQNRIYALSSSDEALERAARTELGLSKPAEIVYIFSEPRRRTASTHEPNGQTRAQKQQ